ncbi:hypothetical protein L2E82_14917 [Cichorium intybus]|uniref:Uncharacterized protein n=1 Tax=Cichorium intybus TaxID=13427 RepID=A0ACB9F1Y6_CICIN|nr:hypothetical protein L2E82_14917 [Cichorium intybus]
MFRKLNVLKDAVVNQAVEARHGSMLPGGGGGGSLDEGIKKELLKVKHVVVEDVEGEKSENELCHGKVGSEFVNETKTVGESAKRDDSDLILLDDKTKKDMIVETAREDGLCESTVISLWEAGGGRSGMFSPQPGGSGIATVPTHKIASMSLFFLSMIEGANRMEQLSSLVEERNCLRLELELAHEEATGVKVDISRLRKESFSVGEECGSFGKGERSFVG